VLGRGLRSLIASSSAVARTSTPYIGDVLKKFAPFLKLYADYVKNFDHAMDMINTWTDKSPEFASLLKALQVGTSVDFAQNFL